LTVIKRIPKVRIVLGAERMFAYSGWADKVTEARAKFTAFSNGHGRAIIP